MDFSETLPGIPQGASGQQGHCPDDTLYFVATFSDKIKTQIHKKHIGWSKTTSFTQK